MQCKVSMPHGGVMVHGLCRDKAVSLSLGLRYITNSICPMLHAYLLQGYYVQAGHPLLITVISPNCYAISLECHNLMKLFCKARRCEAGSQCSLNLLQEISSLKYSTSFTACNGKMKQPNIVEYKKKTIVSTLYKCVSRFNFSLFFAYIVFCQLFCGEKTFCRRV